MKKINFGLLALILCTINVSAAETEIESQVESVTIYHSGALVTRTASTEIPVGMSEIIFRNLSSKIVLNSLKVNNKEVTVLNKSIIRKLTAEEFSQLRDRKEALNKEMTLIETKFNETGFVSKVEELQKMSAFYTQKILQIKKDLRAIEKNIEAAKKLEDIELKNEDAAILKLIVSIETELNQPFEFQYVCGGIGWSPSYDVIVGSSADDDIEVKYLAKAMSQTGEDWDDVTINLSSSFPLDSPTELPKPKEVWTLTGRNIGNQSKSPNEQVEQQASTPQIDRLEGVTYQEINIPSFLKLRTLPEKYSIKSNSTVFTFPIETVKLPTRFYYYGFPSLDPEVYLVAQVTGWDSYGFVDGIANITYGGNDVGKSVIKFSESKDTLLLSVGKDNSVFMKRSEIADQKYFKITSIGKKRVTTNAYQFELKNNNAFPIQFELVDQFPVSQTKAADVELDQVSNANINLETGEVTWLFDLDSKQAASKKLIFTIEMDGSYRYYKGRAKAKFRTVSAPSF